jgi:GNAT superfamily N-acetyltransferase
MSKIIQDCSDPFLPEIIDASWFEFFKVYGSTPEAEMYEGPDLRWVNLKDPHRFNGVFTANLTGEDRDEKIDEVISYFRGQSIPMSWYVGPASKPEDLGIHLEEHDLVHVGATPGMAVELYSLNEDIPWPEGLSVERVRDERTTRDFYDVLLPVNRMRDFTLRFLKMERSIDPSIPRYCYVGYLEEEPVTTSVLLPSLGVAGIHGVATVPEARGRGLGTAISLHALREARDLGYMVGVLVSSEMGYRIYQRLGFKEYCRLEIYRLRLT